MKPLISLARRLITASLTYQQAERIRSAIYAVLYYSGVAWLWSCFRQRSATVFVYHSVGSEAVFADNVVSTDVFERQMRLLRRCRTPVALGDIVAALKEGRTPPADWVAITFDDGYRDFVTTALPILQRYGIPASIFIPTSILRGRPLFFDQVEKVLNQTAVSNIQLQTPQGILELKLGARDRRSDAALRLALEFRQLGPAERAQMFEQLLIQCRVPAPAQPTGVYLSSEDLAALPAQVEVGSHSINHYSLTALDDATLQQELADSRADLHAESHRDIAVLAYPFGKPWAFDARVARAAAKVGYVAALTTMTGSIRAHTNRMEIPRAGATPSLVRMRLNLMGLYL